MLNVVSCGFVGCWADGEEPNYPLAQPQPQAALRATGEFGQIMKCKLSALSGRYLAASKRSLKQGIAQRKTVEAALKKSGEHSHKLLEESLALQRHLQHLAHRILSAQEDNRNRISHELQDEIAQTLLGINVRLLTVKKGAELHTKGLRKEIADTQRLVNISAKSIERFARELGKHHEP